MVERFDKRKMSNKRVIKVRECPGAMISDMGHYLVPLLEKKLDHAILHFASNDVVNYEGKEIVGKLLQLKSFIQEKLPTTNVILSKSIMRVDTKQCEKVVTDVNNKLSELNIDIIDNRNLDRNHLNGKRLQLDGKDFSLYAENLIDNSEIMIQGKKMRKECLVHNFEIPRKHICHDDFNSIVSNFKSQGENIVNNSVLIDTNVSSPNNNLNKTLDIAHRHSEIKDLTEKGISDLLGLVKLRKENPNNPNIAYLNINSLKEKMINLQEICPKSSIDLLCVNETKLDASYPNAQFHIEGYQFPPIRRDRNKLCGGKMVFVRNGIIAKRLESLERRENEKICTEVTISRKKGFNTFADKPPQNGNKVIFFNELNLSLNQCVNKYDNIIVMGDLSIEISDKIKDNNNFRPNHFHTFSLQNIITGKNVKVT